MRPRPIYVDPKSFCALEPQIDSLTHQLAPYEYAMDRYHFPRRVCNQLIQLDIDIQHVNAEMISREVAPEIIQRQIDRIAGDFSWVQAQSCVLESPNHCNKSPQAMAASLDVQLAADRRNKRGTSSPFPAP